MNGAIQNGRYEEALELLEKRIAADKQNEHSLHARFREAAAYLSRREYTEYKPIGQEIELPFEEPDAYGEP